MEAAVKKSNVIVDGEGSSATEVEARIVNNEEILVRVHCAKQKGLVTKLLTKVEALNMLVMTTNVTPFGTAALHITIIAKIGKELSITVDEIATAIHADLSSKVIA